MESLMNNLRRNGDDLTTARSLRLTSRPTVPGIFEDHGQSLVSGSKKKQSSDMRPQVSGIQKFKPAITAEKSKAGPAKRSIGKGSIRTAARAVSARDIELSDSQSDDEMDLLSSRKDTADDPSTSRKRILHTKDDADNGCFDSEGEWHPYLKGFEPKRHISALKFKKNKEVSWKPGSPPKAGNALGSSSKPKREASTAIGDTIYVSRPLSRKDPNSKPENRSQASQEKHFFEPLPVSEKFKFGPPSRSAHPRIKRTNNSEFGKQPTEFSTRKGQNSLDPIVLYVEGQRDTKRRSMSRSRSLGRCSSPKVTVRKLEAFPTLSPPTSPALPKRQPEFFPPLSPLTDSKLQADGFFRRPKPQANPFPMLSPPHKSEEVEAPRGRTTIKRIKGKGKMKLNGDASSVTGLDDEDEAGPIIMVSSSSKESEKGKERTLPESTKNGTKRRPKRFPMSAQMLQSIDSSPTTVSPHGKRLSEGHGDERISKRSKKETRLFPQSPSRPFEEEGDSLLFSPEVDPRSLCPYCDTPLPEHPSSLLLDLIAATRKKATCDPRPSNPLGLKAPVANFVTVCQRHRFESQILPEAEKKGWPKTIEWSKVAKRVMNMKNVLRALIEDPGDKNTGDVGWTEEDWEIPSCNQKRTEIRKQKGPKANNIFWNEVIQEIKEKGLRVVAGVRGQFANFEKAQPGYYGEQGSVIIHQTLYDMFPPSSMDASLIAPLTGNEFKEKILVPEVALRLIMEDRNLTGEEGKQEALTVLRESSSYGVFMFPEDGGEWSGHRRKARDNQLGVGDMIVMQRAMKRRKELEEEKEAEAEKILQSEQERDSWRRMNNRDKESARTQPRPRPLGKASNAISSSQDEFPRSSLPTKQSRSDYEDTDPVSGIETAVEISDSDSDGGWRVTLRDGRHPPSGETRTRGSAMHSTSRAISGLNLSSDTDTSSRAVVSARPFTRSRSRSVVRKAGICSSRMEVDRAYEELIKTPMPARQHADLVPDDTPRAPRSPQRSTPPLMRARRRQNKVAAEPFRQIYETPKRPLPTRIHLNSQVNGDTPGSSSSSQDDRWLLEDYEI